MPAKTKDQLEAEVAEAQSLLKEGADQAEKRAADQTELEKLAEPIVESLIKAGELDESARDQAIKNVVESPVKVAMALKSVADRLVDARNGIPPAPIGSGVSDPHRSTTKQASVKGGKSKADEAFEAHLGF